MRYSSPLAQALGDSLGNVTTMFANQPTPAELEQRQADIEYRRAMADQARAGAALDTAKLQAPGKLAALIPELYTQTEGPRPSPGFVGPAAPVRSFDFNRMNEVAPLAIQAGVDPRYLADSLARGAMLGDPNNGDVSARLNILGDNYANTRGGFDATLGETRRNNDQQSSDRRFVSNNSLAGTKYTADVNNAGQAARLASELDWKTANPDLVHAQGAAFKNLADAGGFDDPNQVYPAGSVAETLLPGNPPSAGGGSGSTPKNYKTPDGKVGMTIDGFTDMHTKEALPAGTAFAGTAPVEGTEAQGKANNYALMMDDAISAINQLPANFDPTAMVINTLGNSNVPLTDVNIGSMFLDPDQQRYVRAARTLLAAILRGDTGAAITAQEFAQYAPIYLPQIGDQGDILRDKWNGILGRRQGFVQAAGSLYKQSNAAIAAQPETSAWGGGAAIPQGAIDMLKQNPNLADQFDAKYGAGASAQVLQAP